MRCRSKASERSALLVGQAYRLGDAADSSRDPHRPALWQLALRGLLNHGNPDEVIIPELYLQAAGEAFTITLAVCWLITAAFNPSIIERNLLRDVVGYNNVCVGFDEAPARFVAAPLFTLISALGMRYVQLDSMRAQLQIIDADETYKITCWQYAFTRFANALYGFFVCCLSLLLVVTPAVHRGWHSAGYVAIITVSWLVIVANYAEAKEVTRASKAWMALFSLLSVLIVVLGGLDFSRYDYEACERAACGRGRRGGHGPIAADCPASSVLAEAARAACEQTPTVPAWLLGTCDFGWFGMLSLTTVFLPKAPPIHVDYELRPISQLRPPRPAEAAASNELGVAMEASLRRRAPALARANSAPPRRFLASASVAAFPVRSKLPS